jgi:hypothetical protein
VGATPFSRGALFAAAVVALLALPAAASADLLYDQSTGTPGGTVKSSHHAPLGSADADAADDFIVPPGLIWQLSSVDVRGSALNPTTATVVLFADGGGRPGTELFRQGGIPFPPGFAENLPLSGVAQLPPGHYWLSVYTAWSSSPWSWGRQSPAYAFPAVWENTLNGDGTGCTGFRPLSQCGYAESQGADLIFRLNGTAIVIAPRRKCKRRRHRQAASAKKRHCRKRR